MRAGHMDYAEYREEPEKGACSKVGSSRRRRRRRGRVVLCPGLAAKVFRFFGAENKKKLRSQREVEKSPFRFNEILSPSQVASGVAFPLAQ